MLMACRNGFTSRIRLQLTLFAELFLIFLKLVDSLLQVLNVKEGTPPAEPAMTMMASLKGEKQNP